MLPLFLLPLLAGEPAPKTRPDLLADARVVVAAITEAARANSRRPSPLTGDRLTGHYVGAAALAARKLPAERRVSAFLVGIGVALDSSDLMRKNPVTGDAWQKIEPAAAYDARVAVLGNPTVHNRHDLAQHFAVSAALAAYSGSAAAETAGILKEILDSHGDSGFSFADLAADLAGIALAERLTKNPDALAALEKRFDPADFVPAPRGLTEGLSSAEFEKRYGSVSDKRFRTALAELKKRVKEMPGLR
jgi:hypothetical protein